MKCPQMANYSSSDESSKAPTKFFHTLSFDKKDGICDGAHNSVNQDGGKKNKMLLSVGSIDSKMMCTLVGERSAHNDKCISVENVVRCPLCCKKQRRFQCRSCVKNGNIVHSASEFKESLFEKQQTYLNFQASLKEYRNHYERLIHQYKNKENRLFEIKQKRQQLDLLQQLIAKKRDRLQFLGEKRDDVRRTNSEKRKNLPNYPIKVKTLEDYVLDRIEKIDELRKTHYDLLQNLKKTTRQGIQQLVEYIFPINEVVLKDEQRKVTVERTEDAETIAALADAKNTSYIRGKWVFHGSGISEVQYRIVAPSLPANGDYTAYLDWLSDNKDDVPKTTVNEITPSRFEAYRIVGALTYTAQLTQLMSFYLNVRLPHKLAYGDFCKKLNEEQFLRKVSRVNSNIMYLAYTQQVNLGSLNENHTLENILAILDLERSDLGRQGYHEVNNAPLMKSIDSLLIGIETATESESEDDNSLRLGWESVPSFPAQTESTIGPQSTLYAEGLLTSAANGLKYMFRLIK